MKLLNTIGMLALLMPDFAEGAISADPLDTNVNDIDTSYPVVPAQNYDLRITKAEKKASKTGGENLVLTLEWQNEVVSVKGDRLSKHKISHYTSITPSHNPGKDPYTLEMIAKSIANLCKAIGLSCSPRDVINNPAMLEGKTVRAKIAVAKETTEYPESNKVAGFVIVK